jgi:hypothetical protein
VATALLARHRWAAAAVVFAVGALFLLRLCDMTFADPDMFHEMALAREALELGYVPTEDHFAYTPTVSPSVHHEWGTGVVLYLVSKYAGPGGIMALKYLLSFGALTLCMWTATRRGASLLLVALLAPIAILGGSIGFTTLRAQVFTLALTALLFHWLDCDRRGSRRWMIGWVPIYLLWLNLHGGFIVGFILLVAHTMEQAIRRAPVRHLVVLIGAGMTRLISVNPFGSAYYVYLAHALTMDRHLISEWWPLWRTDPQLFRIYLVSLVLLAYAWKSIGWRRMPGVLVMLVTAYAAARHTRHLPIYLVAWLSYVPGYLEQTPLGDWVRNLWQRRYAWIGSGSVALGALCLVQAVPREPWRLRMPADKAAEASGLPVYPIAAIDYLERSDFHGNMMVPFTAGGYVLWRLHPQTKVSIDGRYEVAYQPGVLEEHIAVYEAQPGWQSLLARYPTDALLVPRTTPLDEHLPELPDWRRIYRDEAYDIYARTLSRQAEPAVGETRVP